ncbi:uncharacterized protein V6R79_024272 [Siganus canaliculatus]
MSHCSEDELCSPSFSIVFFPDCDVCGGARPWTRLDLYRGCFNGLQIWSSLAATRGQRQTELDLWKLKKKKSFVCK